MSDSQLIAQGVLRLSGKVSGKAGLTVNGRTHRLDPAWDDYSAVTFVGDSSDFEGDIDVQSGTLHVSRPDGAGAGNISVQSGARLALGDLDGNNGPPAAIGNRIDLYGGFLIGTRGDSVVRGTVTVHDDAFVGALKGQSLTFAGTLVLPSGSQLFGTDGFSSAFSYVNKSRIEVSGRLLVGNDTAWYLQLPSVAISGVIESGASQASIDFVGSSELLDVTESSLRVSGGQELSIRSNGETFPLELSGLGNTVEGAGLLGNAVKVTDGATISPGDASVGILTIDGETVIGEEGRLAIELGGVIHGRQYDVLQVSGTAILSGLLDLSLIDGFTPSPDDAFLILSANEIEGMFANAAESITIGDLTLPVTYRGGQVIIGNASAIPEPASLLLLLAAGVTLVTLPRRPPRARGLLI